MRLNTALLLLLAAVCWADEVTEETAKEPFEHANLDAAMSAAAKFTASAAPNPQTEPIPEPKPEPKPEPTAPKEPEPTPEPEPAIKFDNIASEDYGDVVEQKNVPDAIDDEIISTLVDRFLNTGSLENKNAPKFANPAAQALVNSSDYWKTDSLKEAGSLKDEEMLKKWIDGYQIEAQKVLKVVAESSWRYFSNASPQLKIALNEAEEVSDRFVRASSMQAKQFDMESVKDPQLKRLLSFVTFEGMSALSAESYADFNKALNKINREVTDTAICDKDILPPCALKKIDLESIFQNEEDGSRLSTLWINYMTSIAKSKNQYNQLVKLSNEGAKVNGFKDAGAMWRSAFDLSSKTAKPVLNFEDVISKVHEKIQPFYKQLHAYMRRQLSGIYKNVPDLSRDAPIPAHLIGSLEGGDWSLHYDKTKPYDDENTVAEEMLHEFIAKNYTSKKMFTSAYRYFKSVGFPSLPKSYWTNSLFARVWSRDMICNPAVAIDMRDGADFRVKACAQLGEPDFQLAHSLLAQTYYQYLYRDQPILFREPASSPISEAIAKVFSHLSTNPHYLYSQKLVTASQLDIKDSVIVNRLYKEALQHFTKLPFQIAADEWRYALFEDQVPVQKSNDKWWEMRNKYEGVRAPQPYNASNLDALMHAPIALNHNPAAQEIISYIAQFQILKAICPEGAVLSEGCILSEDTTEKLRETMKLGSSITWLKALEMITGKGELDATPLLEYYEPLINWLNNQNEIDQVIVGWDGQGTPFTPEEIPTLRVGGMGSSSLLSEDRVAYPGQECSHGQDCLLDSHCNGTVCVCDDKKFTLDFGGVISCTDSDPQSSGFAQASGGELVVGLFENPTTPEPDTTPKTTTAPRMQRPKSTTVTFAPILPVLISLYFAL